MNRWIERWFRAFYGEDSIGVSFIVLAPDLETAFKLVRVQHPTAASWRCLGKVDPNDRDVCIP